MKSKCNECGKEKGSFTGACVCHIAEQPAEWEKEIYQINIILGNFRLHLTDSFLVEAKDQNGRDRSLERLNADRYIFAERMMELIANARKESYEAGSQARGKQDREKISLLTEECKKARKEGAEKAKENIREAVEKLPIILGRYNSIDKEDVLNILKLN